MKRLCIGLLFGCGVLVFGLAANAQTWDDRYPQQRAYGYGRDQQLLIGRVIADLNRAAERSRWCRGCNSKPKNASLKDRTETARSALRPWIAPEPGALLERKQAFIATRYPVGTNIQVCS